MLSCSSSSSSVDPPLPNEAPRSGVGERGDDDGTTTTGGHRRRNNLGRAARRRRRKLTQIKQAEAAWRASMAGHTATPTAMDGNHGDTHTTPTSSSSSNHNNTNTNNSVLPTDRNRIWPAVLERRAAVGKDQWDEERDASALMRQLGYVPGNVLAVPTRVRDVEVLWKATTGRNNSTDNEQQQVDEDDDDGRLRLPVVVQLYPIVWREEHSGGKAGRKFKSRKRQRQPKRGGMDPTHSNNGNEDDDTNDTDNNTNNNNDIKNDTASTANKTVEDHLLIEPFPTIYWLTHPLLRILVSKLELQGYGTQLEHRLATQADALDSMRQAHAAYGLERWNLLTTNDLTDVVQARRWEAAFLPTRGVAGISQERRKNPCAVKCLHAHAAHYLSGGQGSGHNVVGQWVMEEVKEQWNAATATTNIGEDDIGIDSANEFEGSKAY